MTFLTRARYAVAGALAILLLQPALARDLDSDRIASVAETGMAMWRVPGMAVAVVDKGEVVLQRGFGHTRAGGPPVDEHTLFANASTTKAMIVAGLLVLVDEGRLGLDDPVIEYLPELHFHSETLSQQITLRDLLAHRTGLPSTDFWTFRQLLPLAEQIRRLRLVAPETAPRTRLIYQNTMYELAGLVIERVSGRRWDEFLQDRLWSPIGMHETFGTRSRIPRRLQRVAAHAVVDGDVREIPYDLPADRADAAGSVWSSIHDMTLWTEFLLRGGITGDGKQLVSARGIAAMFEPQQLATPDDFYPTTKLTRPDWRSYGLAWFQQNFDGRKIDFHTGSLDGLVAIIGLDRANGRGVVVMANLDGAELRHALLWDVMDDATGTDRRDWNHAVYDLYAGLAAKSRDEWAKTVAARLKGTQPGQPLAAYLGTYVSEAYGDIVFELSDGRLHLRTGMYDYDVSHWHLDTFLVDYLTWTHGEFASFRTGPRGEVQSVDVFGKTFRHKKADAAPGR